MEPELSIMNSRSILDTACSVVTSPKRAVTVGVAGARGRSRHPVARRVTTVMMVDANEVVAHRRARVDMVDLRLSGGRFARRTRLASPVDRGHPRMRMSPHRPRMSDRAAIDPTGSARPFSQRPCGQLGLFIPLRPRNFADSVIA